MASIPIALRRDTPDGLDVNQPSGHIGEVSHVTPQTEREDEM
jgi:hypothetical protein